MNLTNAKEVILFQQHMEKCHEDREHEFFEFPEYGPIGEGNCSYSPELIDAIDENWGYRNTLSLENWVLNIVGRAAELGEPIPLSLLF